MAPTVDLTVDLDQGREACGASVDGFVRAIETLGEHDLLGASRCHGWTRLDVVTHVIAGWQEMLGGLVSPVGTPPDVDAASYWSSFAADYADSDPVLDLMSQRRRTAAYARPSSAVEHLLDVAAALQRGIAAYAGPATLWQGHVFAPGDFLAIWAVEDVVHHLDLACDEPAPPTALAVTRATVEALAGGPLPATWSDEQVALVGAGRLPVPADAPAGRLPVLG